MKKIKSMAGVACGALFAALSNPLTTKAAVETEERSLGETMGYALLNTVMGIVIVFCVLILISALISLFKYINRFEQKMAAKNAAPVPETPSVQAPEEDAGEELADDLELVAVITAAIHAYEEAQGNDIPADGLVVRSIRKAGKSRWQNA
ncbi:MAG: OadG family protein [Lachnospiraceae bacterium]|nr:OadG family protein [Lachnospiraceae bacterium]